MKYDNTISFRITMGQKPNVYSRINNKKDQGQWEDKQPKNLINILSKWLIFI
jgi:hypothetical protein